MMVVRAKLNWFRESIRVASELPFSYLPRVKLLLRIGRIAFRIFRIAVLLLVLVAIVALAWVRLFGFPDAFGQRLSDELSKKGVPAKFGRIYFDPFQGFVATHVAFLNPKEPSQQLVGISEIGLQLNWKKLLRRHQALEDLRIEDATLSVPLDLKKPQESMVTGRGVFARVRVQENGVVAIDNCSGTFNGVGLALSGTVAFRSTRTGGIDLSGLENPADKPGQINLLARLFREFENVQFSVPPEISGQFHVDLVDPALTTARVQFKSKSFTHAKLKVDSFVARVTAEQRVVRLQEFEAALYGGKITLTGEYDWSTGTAKLDLRSDVNVKPLVEAVGRKASSFFRDYDFKQNPALTCHLEVQPRELGLMIASGLMEANQFTFRGIPVQSFRSKFTLRDGLFRLTNFEGRRAEGTFQGNYECRLPTEDFTLDMITSLHPAPCRAVFPRNRAEFLARFRFDAPPHITFRWVGNWKKPEETEIKGHVHADRFTVDGVPMESLDGDADVRGEWFAVTNLVLKRQEGEVTGFVSYDPATGRLEGNVHSTANPYEIAKLIGTNALAVIKPYEFIQPPTLDLRGRLNFKDDSETHVEGHIEGRRFYWWRLHADTAATDITIRKDLVSLTNFTARIYGGRLTGDADFITSEGKTQYHITALLENADLQPLVESITTKKQKSTGLLSGRVNLTGVAGEMRSLEGAGNIAIEKGVLWEHPVFGQLLSGVLNAMLPGRIATSTATDARGEFVINRGVAEFSRLEVDAGLASIVAKGRYKLWSGGLDFEVEGKPYNAVEWTKLFTWITTPFTKLFTLHLGGSWKEPEWRTVYLPKELFGSSKPGSSDKPKEENKEPAPAPHMPNPSGSKNQ